MALRKELNVSRIYWDFTIGTHSGPYLFAAGEISGRAAAANLSGRAIYQGLERSRHSPATLSHQYVTSYLPNI